MKRLFILATAAIVALASCTKTHVVYNEAPQEISFKQVTNVMTKAEQGTLGDGNTTMGVFAYWGTPSSSYFNNAKFMYDGTTSCWTSYAATMDSSEKDPVYWPVSGNVDFVVYSPWTNSAGLNDDGSSFAYVSSSSSSNLCIRKQLNDVSDWLYGKASGSKSNQAVNVTLSHALSNIEVNITGTSDVTISKVELLNSLQQSIGTIDFSSSPTLVVWEQDKNNKIADMSLITTQTELGENNDQSLIKATGSCLVVPTNELTDEAIKITYKLSGNATYTTTAKSETAANQLGTKWEHGKKYIYNISITPEEIKFNPTVTPWDADFDDDQDITDDDTDITL